MTYKEQPPLNLWDNIKKTWGIRIDLVFEKNNLVAIHNSGFDNVIKDVDWLIKKLDMYKAKMIVYYGQDNSFKQSSWLTYIYLLYDPSTGLHKIGRSKNPSEREKTLHSEKPIWRIIYTSPKTLHCVEKNLHNEFKDKRVRGEWFDLSPTDISFIKRYNYDIYEWLD